MSEKFQETVTVVSQKQIGTGIYDLTIQTKEIAAAAKAGQFVSVYSNDASKLLPRPISLCGIDRKAGTLRLVYRVTGEHTGTEEFSRLQAGDTMKIMGPLGNGFTVEKGRKAFLIGGGIGVPPMLQLAKEMKDAGENFQIVMGYRDAGTFLLDEFKEQGESFVATEDGSVGTKGNVLDAIRENASGCGCHLCLWPDTDAACPESICRRTEHDMLCFHGGAYGMRNRSLSCLCM